MNKKLMIYVSIVISCISIFLIWAIAYSILSYHNAKNRDSIENNYSTISRVIYDNNGNYIKIQNRMSMDWSASDKDWLLLIMDLNDGSIEDRATAMVIALDNISGQNKSIPQYVIDTFGPTISLQYKDIESDEKAYDLVVNKGWDETGNIERGNAQNGKEND